MRAVQQFEERAADKGILLSHYGCCRILEFLRCVTDKALVGHVIKNFTVTAPGLAFCQHKCFIEHECVSYNLGPIQGLLRSCELSDADNVTRPGHVQQKEGSEYCPIKNPCASSSCSANQLCTPLPSMDIYNCSACESPLGMEDGRIQNSQITASSYFDKRFYPWLARLNLEATLEHQGSWTAGQKMVGEYIQIDLGRMYKLTKVATQGRVPADWHTQWVTKYSLAYRADDPTWTDYKENDIIKVFPGNSDKTTVVTNDILVPIVARFVRIIVKEAHEWPSMRTELYGCRF
ncbi:lactadherin-like [Actinia tenebrosa]|uniref:Lactadherin-like n=1 Tax=Actinia tenebrosa TaxID=6105 RepID=A0A6P8J9H4_ACTTE|nr:lactadherin-like [Actinia tenebrosa]